MVRLLLKWLTAAVAAGAASYALFVYFHPRSSPPEATAQTQGATEDDCDYCLGEDERAYLWDIEHHGNVLTKYGFAPLAAALLASDAAALDRLLAADFTASQPRQPRQVHLHSDVLDVTRSLADGGPPRPLDRQAFIAELLSWRRPYGQQVKAKIALMALSPVERGVLEGPWQGTAQLRLWGEVEKGKPAEVIAYFSYRLALPTKERLQEGKWLSSCAITQVQIGTAQRYLFREVARQRGIDPGQFQDDWKCERPQMNGGGVFACDFNRDGLIDLLVTDGKRNALYQGVSGGQFIDVTSRLGLPVHRALRDSGGSRACFVDLDGDGWEDLILGTAVYRNVQGERFEPMGPECNLVLPEDYTAIAVADYDGDGLMDLYVTRAGAPKAGSWLTGQIGNRGGNSLYRNKGNWQFDDVTRAAGVDGGKRSSFTAVWLDADNDGKPDLYVINEFGDGVLYHNQGRGPGGGPVTFTAVALAPPPCDFGAMGVVAGDIDNDGNIDIYSGDMYSKAGKRVIGNMTATAYPESVLARMRTFVTGSQLHHNLGKLKFEQVGQAWQVNDCGWAYGPALADLDNDGFLDLYATCGFISRDRTEPDG
jgi:hypothetical protein